METQEQVLRPTKAVYDLARKHRLYRVSCGTFVLYAVFVFTFKGDELAAKYGNKVLWFASCGLPQSLLSYLGDVVFLGEPFFPDILFAMVLITWACFLYWNSFAFWFSLGLSGIAFSFSVYLNHIQNSKQWLRFHIAWHALPIILYLGTTSATAVDRIPFFGLIWIAVAFHFNSSWHSRSVHHYTHTFLVLAGFLSFLCSTSYNFLLSTTAFSFAYHFTDIFSKCTALLKRTSSLLSAATLLAMCLFLDQSNTHARMIPILKTLLLLDATVALCALFSDRNQSAFSRLVLLALRCYLLPWHILSYHLPDFLV